MKKNAVLRTVFAGFVGVCLLAFSGIFVPAQVFAQDATSTPETAQSQVPISQTELDALAQQIEALLQVIASLQQQIALVVQSQQQVQQQSQPQTAEPQQQTSATSTTDAEMAAPLVIEEFSRELDVGMRGEDVWLLQTILATDPAVYPEGFVTGYYGQLTQNAVSRFQARFGIEPASGKVDQPTMAELNSLVNAHVGTSGQIPPDILSTVPTPTEEQQPAEEFQRETFEPAQESATTTEDTTAEQDSGDTQAPFMQSVSPEDGVVDVLQDASLTITFSENVYAGTGSITVIRFGDGEVVEDISAASVVSGEGTQAVTIGLASDLDSDTDYYVLVSEDAFVDAQGNVFPGVQDPTAWNFKTGGIGTLDGILP